MRTSTVEGHGTVQIGYFSRWMEREGWAAGDETRKEGKRCFSRQSDVDVVHGMRQAVPGHCRRWSAV
jgi:hypothetical protein